MAGTIRARSGRAAEFLIVAMVVLVAAASTGFAAQQRPFGDARILANVPPPGFPEGIAVRGNTVYVAGPATFGTTGRPASGVVAFNTDSGEMVGSWDTRGEDLSREHANSSIAFAGDGRLYVLNTQLGIYRLDLGGKGAQLYYSEPFPDIAPCRSPVATTPCSPTPGDAPPIPNDIVFDAAGDAYVTDSMQATIWRVPRHADADGKRRPVAWFQDERLASEYIGVNGMRLNPERTHLYITVSTDLTGRSLVYTLPVDTPHRDELDVFYEYTPGDLPDGVAFGQSGLLYVALANPRVSGVSILAQDGVSPKGAPKGREVVRLGNPLGSPAYPYDSPANVAFNGNGSILLTNHAIATGLVDASQFSVLDVFVGDKASPLEKPNLP